MSPPTDAALIAEIERALGPVALLVREPYEYATSSPLELLVVETPTNPHLQLIFKDLDPEHRLPVARGVKPAAIHDVRRPVETQRALLDPLGVGPPCPVAIADDVRRRWWLVTERVAGVELWQVGELSTWQRVARWLAHFHEQFIERADDARALAPTLLELDAGRLLACADRAREALQASSDARAVDLLGELDGLRSSVELLEAQPRTFLHGEFYPSNVLVDTEGGVWPIDWELAAIGPVAFDLAALVTGWDDADRLAMIAAYSCDRDLSVCVDAALLHLALRWIGWSPTWQAPPEHARDWIAEALDACTRLEALR